MAENSSPLDMTPVCDSGLWRNEAVLKTFPVTVSCAAKVFAPLCGVKMADGLLVEAATVWSKSSLDDDPNFRTAVIDRAHISHLPGFSLPVSI